MIVDQNNFEKEVIKEKKPVFVEIGADWSGTSHIIAPIIKKLASKYKDQVKFVKIDTNSNSELQKRFYNDGIPVLLIFKNGEIEDSIKGVFSYRDLENKICETIS